MPPEALAAGRVVVEFTDKPQPSTFPDLTKYRDGTTIISARPSNSSGTPPAKAFSP